MNSQLFPSEFHTEVPSNRSKLILSVDDEPIILYTRKQILELEGYTVLSALDGEDALELFDAYPVIFWYCSITSCPEWMVWPLREKSRVADRLFLSL